MTVSQLSQRLRRLRTEFGMNQSDVAAQVGLSRSAVAQIESGNRDVSADEVVRFSSVFQQSPAALLAGLGRQSDDSATEKDRLLDEILGALEGLSRPDELRRDLDRAVQLAARLGEIETDIGANVYGPEAVAFHGTTPRSQWEAAHQGYAVAEEERRRLDLGSAPIRDVAETLATLRVRTSRLDLPKAVSCLYIHTVETGPLVIVDEVADPGEQRFWMVHGYAHVLFEPERRWLACGRHLMSQRHEVRANAFASRFLIPSAGVERFLRSIGRDTMAAILGGLLEVLSDSAATPAKMSRVRVSGRSRRGDWEFNPYELSQVASYFGVTRSLVAHTLRNLRLISRQERDRLIDSPGDGESERAGHTMRSRQPEPEGRREAFVSRLLALAAQARRRGTLSPDRIEAVIGLLGLSDEEQASLLGTAPPGFQEGAAPVRKRGPGASSVDL